MQGPHMLFNICFFVLSVITCIKGKLSQFYFPVFWFGVSSLRMFMNNSVRNCLVIIWIMKYCAELLHKEVQCRQKPVQWCGWLSLWCDSKTSRSLSVFREENTVTTRAMSEETLPPLLHCQRAMDFSKCPDYFGTMYSLNHLFYF